jgi:hypothetical protein
MCSRQPQLQQQTTSDNRLSGPALPRAVALLLPQLLLLLPQMLLQLRQQQQH